ncbi:MAG: hypothetical protein ACO1PI_05015 [Bacteroidota bacterium]
MKQLYPLIFFGLLLFSLFSGCSNDLDVNGPPKEVMIIYGLLNANDSEHYIRLNKAFLSGDESAFTVAKISDSIYYDSVEVTVEEFDGHFMRSSFKLQKKFIAKDSGIFATEGSHVYYFKAALNTNYRYKLIVFNKRTQKIAIAETRLVGFPKPILPNPATTDFILDTARPLRMQYVTPQNAKMNDIIIRFYWDEYDSATGQLVAASKYIDWPVLQSYVVPSNAELKLFLKITPFYYFLADRLPVLPARYRVPMKLDFMFWTADKEYKYYQDIVRPNTMIMQKKPEYTNISDGNLGLFASRSQYIIKGVTIGSSTKKLLRDNQITRKLNFRLQ